MTSIGSIAIRVIAIVDPWLAAIAGAAWSIALLTLIAPAWRLLRGHGRYLDPIWAVLLLGVGNRLASDFLGVPATLQHLSAVIIAALLALVVRSYQHADA